MRGGHSSGGAHVAGTETSGGLGVHRYKGTQCEFSAGAGDN